MEFNEAQMRAVSHKEGPAMVLAGPGSGKTTVITHRVKKLIEDGVSPEKNNGGDFYKSGSSTYAEKIL